MGTSNINMFIYKIIFLVDEKVLVLFKSLGISIRGYRDYKKVFS